MFAADNGYEQVARVLLEAGAVVSAQNDDGFTAVMLAEQKWTDAHLDGRQNDAGWTALMDAAEAHEPALNGDRRGGGRGRGKGGGHGQPGRGAPNNHGKGRGKDGGKGGGKGNGKGGGKDGGRGGKGGRW